MSRRFRTYSELRAEGTAGVAEQVAAQRERIAGRLAPVGRVVPVTSGKGGVGKSFVAAALAAACRRTGAKVGLLDADLQGPTAARMCGTARSSLRVSAEGVHPPVGAGGVAVMSMALLLEDGAPLTWRRADAGGHAWSGLREHGALREFLADVVWGELDLLFLDLPPGTRRLAELAALVPRPVSAVAVTIPAGASAAGTARALAASNAAGIPVAGVVENMAGYACPGCREVRELFAGDAGPRLAAAHGVPLLARLPFDPEAGACAERGDLDALLDTTSAGRALAPAAAELLRCGPARSRGGKEPAP